jgi:stearoyl-CoA desaturase (delta-9 desaturase)
MASTAPASMAKTSEPNRNKRYDPKKPHITEEPITKANWYKHVNWLNITLIVGVPIYGLFAAYWTPLQWKTAVWSIAYYFMTGLGITAGKFFLPANEIQFVC